MFEATRDRPVQLRKYGGAQTSCGEVAWIKHRQAVDGVGVISTSADTATSRLRVTGKSGRSYIPDGRVLGTNLVYEYLGGYWHARDGTTESETEAKLKDMEDAGYEVRYVWEKDFASTHQAEIEAAGREMMPPFAYGYLKGTASERARAEAILQPEEFQVNLDICKKTFNGKNLLAVHKSTKHPKKKPILQEY